MSERKKPTGDRQEPEPEEPEKTQSESEILSEFCPIRTPWYQDTDHALVSDSASLDSLLCLSVGIRWRPLTIKVRRNTFMLNPSVFDDIGDHARRAWIQLEFSRRIDLVNAAIRAGVLTPHRCEENITVFNPKDFFTWAREKHLDLPERVVAWHDSLPYAADAPTADVTEDEAALAEATSAPEEGRQTVPPRRRRPGRLPSYDDDRDRRVWAMWKEGRYKTFDAFVEAYKRDLHEDYNSATKMRKLSERIKKRSAE